MGLNDKELKIIAEKLKATELFTGNTDLDRLINKQYLFLLTADLIPTCQVVSGHMGKTKVPNSKTVVPDDLKEVAAFLDELGLVYKLNVNKHYVHVTAAKTEKTLKKLLAASDPYEISLLLGAPETAAAAFKNKTEECFSIEEQEELLKKNVKDKRFIKLFSFFLSKKHYSNEIKEMEKRFELLRKFGLVD